jgi:hypothetical protein
VAALAGCSALRDRNEPAALHGGNWHSYGNAPTNANRVGGGLPALDEHELLAAVGWPYTPPVVHDGVAYVAADRQVVAVAIGGEEQWSRRLDTRVSGAPAIDPGRGRLHVPTRVVPTSNDRDAALGSLTTLSLSDGTVVGASRVGDRRVYGVTAAHGDVFVRTATACVRLAPDGSERWRRSLDPLVYDEYNLGDDTATQVAPAVTGDAVYVPDRHAVVKLDPESGDVRWRVPVDTPYAASVVGVDGVVQTGWQETVAVDHAGDVRWRRTLQSRAAAATGDGDVYVVAGDLHELDGDTGETTWQAHLPSDGTAAPVVTDESVLAVTGDVHAFRRDAGGGSGSSRERWQTSDIHASAYASPVVAAGRVFVAGPLGLLAFRPGEGG